MSSVAERKRKERLFCPRTLCHTTNIGVMCILYLQFIFVCMYVCVVCVHGCAAAVGQISGNTLAFNKLNRTVLMLPY